MKIDTHFLSSKSLIRIQYSDVIVVAQNQTRGNNFKSICKEVGDNRTLQSMPCLSRFVMTLDIPCFSVIDLIIPEEGCGRLNPN